MDIKQLRILFIKPGDFVRDRIWAMHHFSAVLSLYNNLKIFFLTENFELSSEHPITVFSGYPRLSGFPRVIPLYFRRLSELCQVYKRVKPHIIHVNNHIGAFGCLVLARVFLQKVIVILDIRTLPDKRFKYWYYRLITPFFDWVFALNDEIIKKMVNNRRHSPLPLGFDSALFRPPHPPRAAYQARTLLKCLYFGSLDRKRNLIVMIKGFITAINAGYDIRLTVAGTGNGKQELVKEVAGSRLQHAIRFYSFVPQTELVEIIRNHDIGISFVPNKGMYVPQVPLKAVEMLACGLPVMATDTKGNREVVEHLVNGYITDGTTAGVANTLQEIWENGIPEQISQRAIASVQHLSWKGLTERYLIKTYKNLVENRCPRSARG